MNDFGSSVYFVLESVTDGSPFKSSLKRTLLIVHGMFQFAFEGCDEEPGQEV